MYQFILSLKISWKLLFWIIDEQYLQNSLSMNSCHQLTNCLPRDKVDSIIIAQWNLQIKVANIQKVLLNLFSSHRWTKLISWTFNSHLVALIKWENSHFITVIYRNSRFHFVWFEEVTTSYFLSFPYRLKFLQL